MKINIDRLAVLAGISNSSESRQSLHEGAKPDLEKEMMSHSGSKMMEEEDPEKDDKRKDEMDEMIEIDEVMLVQELRRAKKMMLESAQASKAEDLQEQRLKQIIEEEVNNVFSDLNLNAGWVYGNNKPKRSRQGSVHQGTYLKGFGFK